MSCIDVRTFIKTYILMQEVDKLFSKRDFVELHAKRMLLIDKSSLDASASEQSQLQI